MIGIHVPDDKKLETRLSYNIPDQFVSVELARVEGRKWWQFWLPEVMCSYTVMVPKDKTARQEIG